MSFQIRPYQQADKPQLLALSMKAWAPVFPKMKSAVVDFVYNAFYPNGWQRRQAADIDAFLDAEGDNVWVAIDEETILGWVGVRLHTADNMGEIYILAVDPAQQRRGVGTSLVGFAMTKMRDAGMAIVMVETGDDPGHAPSRATYESAGFERWPVARYFRKL